MRRILSVAAAVAMIAAGSITGTAQKTSVADVAKALSGTWVINRALSPAFAPGRSNGGRAGGGPSYTLAGLLVQRGGRGGGAAAGPGPSSNADLTPEELADRNAMQQLRPIAAKLTIAATPESVTITDERGERTCALNGKNEKVQMFNVEVGIKCRWDKDKLRQEFSTTRSKLIRVWGLDGSGHLILKAKLEGIGQNTPEATAVFDRSQ